MTVRLCDRGSWKCEFDHTQGRHQCIRPAVWRIDLVIVTATGRTIHGEVDLALCNTCRFAVQFVDVIPLNKEWHELCERFVDAGFGLPIHDRCSVQLWKI